MDANELADELERWADDYATTFDADTMAVTAAAELRRLKALEKDAMRYRWLRSEGLSLIKWEQLTTETCDVGLDGAIDIAMEAK